MRPSTRTGAFLPTASLLAVSSVERAQRLATQFVIFFGASMCCAAGLAFIALRTSGEPSTLDGPAMLTLTGLYLSIGVLALSFAWLHHRRHDLQGWQDEGFERALLALLLAVTALWTWSVHLTGWMTTTVVISPMVVCCMAIWVLRWRWLVTYALANILGLAVVSWLEVSGAVDYAPIIADRAATVAAFTSWRFMAFASLAGVVLYVVALVLLREVRRRVDEGRLELSRRVAARTEELQEANARLQVETAADARARASLAEVDAALAVRRGELELAGRLAALGQLTSTIASALDQPLDAMDAAVCRAEARIAASEDLSSVHDALTAELEAIQAENAAATATIRRLRALFGGASGEASAVDLSDTVEQVSGLLGDPSRLLSVDIEVTLEAHGRAVVNGDPSGLLQAVFNLLNHSMERVALTASGARQVFVEVRREREWVVLDVADNGPAVTEEQRLYQTFVAPKLGGISVGLGLAKSIVDAHQGHLSDGVIRTGLHVFRMVLPASGTSSESP